MDRLRIGIDGYNLALPNGTGIATYGHVLANTLLAAGHEVEGVFGLDVRGRHALRETLFFDQFARAEPPPRSRREAKQRRRSLALRAANPLGTVAALPVPLTDRVVKEGLADRFPAFTRLSSVPDLFELAHRHFQIYGRFLTLRLPDAPDIMHWTYPLPIRVAGAHNIYTLHDVVPLKLPYTTLDVKRTYQRIAAGCVRHGAAICTVSEASRQDIIDHLDAGPDHVVNTYQASSLSDDMLRSSPEEDPGYLESAFGLQRDGYFLFFGAVEPKKNIGRMIEAYLALGTNTPLVIVGGRAWQSEGELALLPREGQPGAPPIVRLDYLPRAVLQRLIRGARAVLFPSLYEGFGLPVLEAIQLGTPVLTAKSSSLPEVAGNAAVYVDPYDVQSIAAGLRRLDEEPELRARLRSAGPQQARNFSRERYLERLETLYTHVLDRR